jgi:hypothetical protein
MLPMMWWKVAAVTDGRAESVTEAIDRVIRYKTEAVIERLASTGVEIVACPLRNSQGFRLKYQICEVSER